MAIEMYQILYTASNCGMVNVVKLLSTVLDVGIILLISFFLYLINLTYFTFDH